jgi:tetratricopeptide (TPR) repeat protein
VQVTKGNKQQGGFTMNRIRVVGWVGIVLLAAGLAASAEPKPLTAEQKVKLQERDGLVAVAMQLRNGGKQIEAAPILEKSLALEREVFGNLHPQVVFSLKRLAQIHESGENYTAARKARQEALDIETQLIGPKDWRVTDARLDLVHLEALAKLDSAGRQQVRRAETLNGQVAALRSRGRFKEALPLAREALEIRRQLLTENHPDYAASLNNLALLYKDMGDYPKALPLYQQARDLRKKLLTENHPSYAASLHNLAMLYQAMGDHPKALPLLEQARDLYKKLLTENHPDYAQSLHSLALLYMAMGDYAKALPLFEQARDLRKKLLTENHPSYANSLMSLAVLYKALGDYPKALPLFEQARDLRKKLLTENHPSYADSLHSLALLYMAMGDYPRALPLFEQARDLRKKLLTENHPEYVNSLVSLAVLYKAMGDYPKALPLLEQARDLYKKLLTENHPHYATSLNSLALLYQATGDYAKALPLFEQACDLRKKLLTENHSDYAVSVNNLALLYMDMGDYPKALPLLEQARDLHKKLLGENHPFYAVSLNNLAMLHRTMGDHLKALPLLEQARDLRKKLLGENHPDYAQSLNNLAALYQAMGKYPQSQRLSRQAFETSLQLVQETFDVLGERQRLQAVLSLQRYHLRSFLHNARYTHLPAPEAYAALLKWKGTVAARLGADLLLRDQPALQPILTKLISLKSQLAKTAFETPGPAQREAWLRRLKQLRDDKEVLEEQLARASITFRNLRRPAPSPEQLRQALPERTALIDLVVFRSWVPPEKRQDKNKEEGQNHLVAFVVRPDQDVRMVFVDDLKSLETLIENWRQAVADNNHAVQAEAAKQIHERLWQPLQQHLDAVDTVLISPDGPLLRFPFAALPGQRPGSFLLEDLAIGYVTSGRQVVDLLQPADKDLTAPVGLLTLGGVDYGARDGAKQAFTPLPGTDLEAARMRQQFRQRFPDERATTLVGAQPTRGNVMAEVNKRYRYLHLATHGFFESPDRIARLRAGLRLSEAGLAANQGTPQDDILAFLPLLRSGLALAGANKGSGDEALLTAEDLSGLDLRGADLVVLSACETSLGNLTQGDGVLGLQRGFHAGGARSVVASLWSVHDAATSVLMEEFYNNLWREDKPLGKLEALRQAQLTVLRHPERVIERSRELRAEMAKRGWAEDDLRGPKGKKAVELPDGGTIKPGQPRRSPPAWWAAFVLSGEVKAAKR